MAVIQSGASTDLLTVDPTAKAARVLLYDAGGNVIAAANRAAVADLAGGQLASGKEYKVSRTLRASSIGSLQVGGDESIMLADSFEGTVRNLNQWIETASGMSSAQTLATGTTLNSGAVTTTATGIIESSHRQFPFTGRAGLVFRAHCRVLGLTNCVQELGFSDQASATTAVHNNGAFFRRDSAGSLQPVLAFNGTETQGTVMTSPATTDYAWYEVYLEEGRALFQILSHAGVLVSSQVMEIGSSGGGAGSATQARMFAVTHLPCMLRVVNTGTAGTAPQIIVSQVAVYQVDTLSQRDHQTQQSALGLNSLSSPTAYTQLANYANSAAPASATLSNTAAGYTNLGGQWQFAAVAGAETDYALFGFTNPSPYTLYVTSVAISAWVQVIAITTTSMVLQWGIAANSSAVSLATAAPYTPMRKTIGAMSATVGTPPGDMFDPGIMYAPVTPECVQPGRLFHVILKIPLGTATGSQIIRGTYAVGGFFE